MNRYSLTALSVAGGLLCGLAWTAGFTGLILLVALVPFLLTGSWLRENQAGHSPSAILSYVFPGFLLFAAMAIGWMRSASLTGALMVVTGLAVLMSLVLWLSHLVSLRAGRLAGEIAFVSIWMTYEFISLNISIVSPWLNLGNGLARELRFIQWYEYTGTAGGTLWILLSNLLLARFLTGKQQGPGRAGAYLAAWLLLIVIPSVYSVFRFYTISDSGKKAAEVVLVQPDIDPFTEKFVIPFNLQLGKAIGLAKDGGSAETEWIVMPETTVDDPVDLDSTRNNRYLISLRELTSAFPKANIVAGLVSKKVYTGRQEAPTKSARKTGGPGEYTDNFNSAFRVDSGYGFDVYHKSKLVPGIEQQFMNGPGKILVKLLPYLGGTKWGYGMQDQRSCLEHSLTGQKAGAVICYESVFGSFVTGYVKNGATLLFIITNDGWWKNTSGYKQHLWYASLRAIETRRAIARSANTGVSCFINIKGERTSETPWWEPAVLRGHTVPETRLTFYVRHGDYLLHIAVACAILTVLHAFLIARPSKK